MPDTPTINRPTCRRDCSSTWRYEHGGAAPGGPFPGTMADRGDVRRCEHGRIWVATGRIRESQFYVEFDQWKRLTWWGSPIRLWRARHALIDAAQEPTDA